MRTIAIVILLLPLLPTTAVADEQPARPGPASPPTSLTWRSAEVGSVDVLDVAAAGVLVAGSTTRPARVLDPGTGAVLIADAGDCRGTGAAGADVQVDVFTDADGLTSGGEVSLVDEHTGVATASSTALDFGSEPLVYQGCEVLGAYGDQVLVTVDVRRTGSLGSFALLFGISTAGPGPSVTWTGSVGTCPSAAAGFSEGAPSVIGGIVVRTTTTDCAGRVLTAQELRTGDVLAEVAAGAALSTGITPRVAGALAGALTFDDQLIAADLLPTADGLRWTVRWTRELVAGELLGEGGDVLVVSQGEEILTLDASSGATLATLPRGSGVLVGSDGVVYRGESSMIIAHEPDGQVRWTVDIDAFGDTAATVFPAAIGPDGALYAAYADGLSAESVLVRLDLGGAVEPPGVVRVDAGDDPIDMAVQTCRRIAPTYQQASRVLIARSDVFADALAGAALAGTSGCILYVDGGPDAVLDRRTLYETARVLPAGGQVYVLGGTNAVSTQVEADLRATGYELTRFAGATRIETAALIAREVARVGFAQPRTTAYLATAGNFPDAVTAGAHAALLGIPVLLSDRDALPAVTAEALTDLGVTRTVLLGGPVALSDTVLAAVPGGERVAGETRFGTAAAVATQLWDPGVVRGLLPVAIDAESSWRTALAAAPLAASLRAPQIGVATVVAPQESIDAVVALREAAGSDIDVTAVGSPTVLPSAVLSALLSPAPSDGDGVGLMAYVDPAGALVLADGDGSNASTLNQTETFVGVPTFADAGTRVAAIATTGGESVVVEMELSTGAGSRLYTAPDGATVVAVAGHPALRSYAVTLAEPDGTRSLVIAEGDEVTRGTGVASEADFQISRHPWHPSDPSLAYSVDGLLLIDDGTGPSALIEGELPVWGPGGIAFSAADGTTVIDPQTMTTTRLDPHGIAAADWAGPSAVVGTAAASSFIQVRAYLLEEPDEIGFPPIGFAEFGSSAEVSAERLVQVVPFSDPGAPTAIFDLDSGAQVGALPDGVTLAAYL